MKYAIIGASGHLGSALTKEALDRGHAVTALIHNTPCQDPRAQELKRDLFELTRADIAGYDVLLSAYGSGFEGNPTVNQRVILHLADITAATNVHLILIGGAGCLYADETETSLVYQQPTHPPFLRGISQSISEGFRQLSQRTDCNWTFVCPSIMLDFDGPKTSSYLTGTDRHPVLNDDGSSYVTCGDLAAAMVDFGEQNAFVHQLVTVASRKGASKW